jgi:hypothetical protein
MDAHIGLGGTQMIVIRPHNPQDYALLPNIDRTNVSTLSADDQACIHEVGTCVLQAKAHERFGVVLLHSHFPIEIDEILFEDVDTRMDLISLRPVRNPPPNLFPTSVCFDDTTSLDEEVVSVVGLEFAPREALAGVAPIDDFDCNILSNVRRILYGRGKTRRFGIRLLHDPLKLNGRVLLETCDSVSRVLTCKGRIANDVIESVATVFRWEQVWTRREDGLAISQECMQFCKNVQECIRPIHGSHQSRNNHESTHDHD